MKRQLVAAAILILALTAASPSGHAGGAPIRIATGEWPPYTSETIKGNGAAVEIVCRTFQRMGVTVELVFYPWNRCYESVQLGKVWGAFPYAYTTERARDVDFSDTILFSTSKLFYYDQPPTGLRFRTIADLKGRRIGGVRGYHHESLLRAAGIAGDYAPKPLNGLEKLMLGRTDLFVSNELVGWFLIRRAFPEKVHRFGTLPRPLHRHGLRMIVSRSHPRSRPLLEAFNAALATVKDDMVYRSLLKKLQQDVFSDAP